MKWTKKIKKKLKRFFRNTWSGCYYKKEIAFINLLFISNLLKSKFSFYKIWKKTYNEMFSNEDFNMFFKFVNILSNIRFYNLRNFSKNNIARRIFLENKRVISKFNLFPNQNIILGYFYEKNVNIEILVFYRAFKGKEKYKKI